MNLPLLDESDLKLLKDEAKRLAKKREQHSEWQRRNSEKVNLSARQQRRHLREEVIQRYGGQCLCCLVKELRFLTINHRDGGGNAHRREAHANGSGAKVYRLILAEGFKPEKYEVLCFNCHLSTNDGQPCPHKMDTKP